MTVLSVTEDTRQATSEVSAGDLVVEGKAHRVFNFILDPNGDPVNMPIEVTDYTGGDAGVPAIWDSHPYDPDFYCVRKNAAHKGACNYELICEYNYLQDPLNQPPIISIDYQDANEGVDRDTNGDPITNSADEPFDPPITIPISDMVITVEKNLAVFDYVFYAGYKNTINSDSWMGFAPKQVKCGLIRGKQVKSGGLTYWVVTFDFIVRYSMDERNFGFNWQRRIKDQGYRIKNGTDTSGKPKYISLTDSNGNPLMQPAALDGSGNKLSAGAAAVYLTKDVYLEKPFAALGLELL